MTVYVMPLCPLTICPSVRMHFADHPSMYIRYSVHVSTHLTNRWMNTHANARGLTDIATYLPFSFCSPIHCNTATVCNLPMDSSVSKECKDELFETLQYDANYLFLQWILTVYEDRRLPPSGFIYTSLLTLCSLQRNCVIDVSTLKKGIPPEFPRAPRPRLYPSISLVFTYSLLLILRN